MFEDFHRLHVQLRVVSTLQRQDLVLLKENVIVSVGECMFGHHRFLWLPQVTTTAVFTNANMCVDAALHGANVHFTG